jgi:DNA polymerase I-like protein with 3'-5' exonuclease and polymerase domains
VIMQAALRIARRGYQFCLQAHDELVFCIPDNRLDDAKTIIMQEMMRPPVWMPELPLAVEVKVGDSYGSCE